MRIYRRGELAAFGLQHKPIQPKTARWIGLLVAGNPTGIRTSRSRS